MSLNLKPHSPAPLTDLLTRAAFAPIENVGWLRVTGEDRVRWLNGMVTNSIQELEPGESCYNFFLNAQGRIQGDCTAWMQEDCILLETAADRLPTLVGLLERFIIMDDVVLTPLEDRRGLLLAGPHAQTYLHALSLPTPQARTCCTTDAGVNIAYTASAIVPTFEIWSDAVAIATIAGTLGSMLEAPGQADAATLEQLRVLEGTPRYGVDIRDRELPQETAQTRALHFAKGCYLGQEIVERIRSRGAVHRTFSGFILTGELPAAGALLTAADAPERAAGELTSVARIQLPGGTVQLALGYIRRDAIERNATITYPGGNAVAAALPFQLPELRA